MPLEFSHCATLTPSFSHPRMRSAPPGATTTAVPVALAGEGRNTDTDGSLTLLMVLSPAGDVVVASGTVQFSDPGALPGHRRITSGVCAVTSLAIATSPTAMTVRSSTDPTACLSSRPPRADRCTT